MRDFLQVVVAPLVIPVSERARFVRRLPKWSGRLAFVTRESFSFDPFDLHDDPVLHDHRHLAKLQANERLSNVFDRIAQLSRIPPFRKRRFGRRSV